jgi:hypothetical protein
LVLEVLAGQPHGCMVALAGKRSGFAGGMQ